MCPDMRAGSHVWCPLLFFHFNQSWRVCTNFIKQVFIKTCSTVVTCSSTETAKVKVSPQCAMQAQIERTCIALLILNLGPTCGLVVNMTPWSLYPQDSSLAPTVQEAWWVPGPVWTGVENLAPPPGLKPQTIQTIGSCYTDCAILAHYTLQSFVKKKCVKSSSV